MAAMGCSANNLFDQSWLELKNEHLRVPHPLPQQRVGNHQVRKTLFLGGE